MLVSSQNQYVLPVPNESRAHLVQAKQDHAMRLENRLPQISHHPHREESGPSARHKSTNIQSKSTYINLHKFLTKMCPERYKLPNLSTI